ncbi:helix-turn-helix domain-containing protein [Priestia megaterium]|uniref:helix-turn-helix transcriptional regulator n=1 Tax=Priestia megaterium TaxID=1404 RepID=UPI0039C1F40F
MVRTLITFEGLEAEVFNSQMEELFKEAYKKGVEDGKNHFSYPPVLTNKDLAEIFQIADSTVTKLTADPSFPRLSKIKGRYPRDKVFEWINQNSTGSK